MQPRATLILLWPSVQDAGHGGSKLFLAGNLLSKDLSLKAMDALSSLSNEAKARSCLVLKACTWEKDPTGTQSDSSPRHERVLGGKECLMRLNIRNLEGYKYPTPTPTLKVRCPAH